MANIETGSILIADPFLKDPNFLRTVVFLCDHQTEGSIGFVINRLHGQAIGELISGLEDCDFPVYYGGPVQLDSVHFLHQCPDLISDGIEVTDGIFWGGNFEQLTILLKKKLVQQHQVRFFIGYSGWGEGQLAGEFEEKSWLITNGNRKLVFHKNTDLVWKDALKQIGGEYVQLINYPIDPQLN